MCEIPRKLYEISSKGADEIVDGALLVKLQSENARLKQCIVQLYSSNTNKESSLESELSAMKDRVHQLENAKQADWSIKAAKYLTEIASLKVDPEWNNERRMRLRLWRSVPLCRRKKSSSSNPASEKKRSVK